jgi:uncharacterized membrane protein
VTTLQSQTVIDLPLDDLFAHLADLRNHVAWSGGQAISKTSDGPVAAGTTYETEEQGPFGRTIRERSVVTDYQPNQRFGWRSYGPLGTWLDWSFELRPHDDGTLLTQRLEPKPGLLTAIAMKLFVERQMRRSMPESLARMKAALEAQRAT